MGNNTEGTGENDENNKGRFISKFPLDDGKFIRVYCGDISNILKEEKEICQRLFGNDYALKIIVKRA